MAMMRVRKRGQAALPRAIREAYRLDDGSEPGASHSTPTRFDARVLRPSREPLAQREGFAALLAAPADGTSTGWIDAVAVYTPPFMA